MVANLTLGKKKYAGSEARDARSSSAGPSAARARLMALARQDSEAFEAVLRARRLPQATPGRGGRARAGGAGGRAGRGARSARDRRGLRSRWSSSPALAAKLGNANAITDAGVAGLLARAAGEGALLNVEINLKSLVGFSR